MELNWPHQSRWQRGNPVPADPLPPYSPEPPTPPEYPQAGPSDAWGHPPHPDGQAQQNGQPQHDRQSEPEPGHPEGAPSNGPRRKNFVSLAWLRQVSFRSRISVLVGMAVGIAVAMASLVSYIAVSHQLERQVASNLQNAASLVHLDVVQGPGGFSFPNPNQFVEFDARTGDFVQVISEHGFANGLPGQTRFFPMSAGARRALKESPGSRVPIYENLTVKGSTYRVMSEVTNIPGLVVQIGYNMTNVDNSLAFLRGALILVALGGVALAAGLGWAVGRASIRPVEDLTVAVEHVTATQDLTSRIHDEGNDELARLARSFNAMLAALAASKDQQAQLVSDAGHELRTPLTSLRTNIEVLMRTKDLPAADRNELLADVDAQLKELTTLVGDLVDLAKDDEKQQAEPELVDFDELVEHAVERAQRRAMSVDFDVSLQPGQVYAQPALLERAVMNVLDNAAKWSPSGGQVNVSLKANGAWRLTVTDQGPGVAPEDLPRIFERFYRAPTARAMPGSGLGLAIVKRVVTSHGGTVDITSPPEGGTKVQIVLPLDEKARSTPGNATGGNASNGHHDSSTLGQAEAF